MASKTSKFSKIAATIALSFIGGFIALVYILGNKESNSLTGTELASVEPAPIEESSKTLRIGEIGVITETIPAGTTKEAYEQVLKAATANDNAGINELIHSGKAVYIEKGTKAKYLEPGAFKKRVRLEDGANKGVAVYVPTEYLKAI